jgi:hypothetical protein
MPAGRHHGDRSGSQLEMQWPEFCEHVLRDISEDLVAAICLALVHSG